MAKSSAFRIVIDQEYRQEIFQIGDTVKLIDSPYDRIKRGAKGKVIAIHGNIAEDKYTQIDVQFKLEGRPFPLSTSACRYRLVKRKEDDRSETELPDADNDSLDDEDED